MGLLTLNKAGLETPKNIPDELSQILCFHALINTHSTKICLCTQGNRVPCEKTAHM